MKLYSGYGWWIVTCISPARTGPGTWRLWLAGAGAGAGLLTCTAASSQGEARVQTRLELRQQEEEEEDDITAAPDQYDLTVMSGDISDAEFLEAMVVVSAVLGGY